MWILNTRQSHVGALGHAAPCWKGLKFIGFPENGLYPSPKELHLSKQELQVLCPVLQQCQGSPHFSLEVTVSSDSLLISCVIPNMLMQFCLETWELSHPNGRLNCSGGGPQQYFFFHLGFKIE